MRIGDLNRGRFFDGKDMLKAILGIKLGQSQQFTDTGSRIAVTRLAAGPCYITDIKDMPDYKSIQLGFGNKKHISKAELGHQKKAGLTTKLRFLRSFTVSELTDTDKPGVQINVGDVFTMGDVVRVTGTSKGKGFAGVVKRHGFAGGPRTHGQSDRERAPGSIGQTTTPGRVYRGKRMAGRMGGDRVTVRNLHVVGVNPEENLLTVTGVVPGAKNSLVVIAKEG